MMLKISLGKKAWLSKTDSKSSSSIRSQVLGSGKRPRGDLISSTMASFKGKEHK
jgi:hypothetical protein